MSKQDDLIRELLQTFQAEAAEHLQTLNLSLLALEVRPEEARRHELVQEAFRAAHSLKGAARAVGLDQIEQLAHAMENVLEKARDQRTHLPATTYDGLYDVLDAIGHVLEGQTVAVEPLVESLSASTAAAPSPESEPEMTPAAEPVAEATIEVADAIAPAENLANDMKNGKSKPKKAAAQPQPAPVIQEEIAVQPAPMEPPAPPAHVAPPAPAAQPAPAAETGQQEEPVAVTHAVANEETIRVAIAKLDNLMAQVGELLVSRMNAEQRTTEMQAIRYQFAGWPKVWREVKTLLPQIDGDGGKRLSEVLTRYQDQFQSTTQDVNHFDQRLRQDTLRLGIIASQLQDNVRHVRMVPFETIVPGLQRAVRDAARSEGKQVNFKVEGGEVELDKKVLENLKDPLLHMLRNAVGHGIELPEVRKKLGKPADGRVTLSLHQRGAEVRISVGDDGKGFDLGGLRRASTEKASYTPDERASDDDIIGLAFLPGVTTTHEVTALSGRGIGLDVVRQRLESLQGRIEVDSVPGKGRPFICWCR